MEERHRGATRTEPGGRAARWTRGVLPASPPLPRPHAPHLEPLRRSWLVAGWQARLAVQAGISLDDFLRARLARYLGALHVARGRLPLAVEIDDGQLRVTAAAAAAAPAPEPGPDAWLAPLVAVDGPTIRDEVSRLEVRAATLEGEIDAGRRRADELSRRLAADVAAGIVAGPTGVEATAEQLGRPPVRGASTAVLAAAVGVGAVAAETWQIAQPLLRGAGLDPSRLAAEAARAPADAAFSAVFALGVAIALTGLAHAALGAAARALHGEASAPRRRWDFAVALGAPAVAALVAAAVTSLPLAGVAQVARAPLVVLLVAVPFAAALSLQAAARDAARRREDVTAALGWDRERARALSERARRLEEVAWADDEVRTLERDRDAARRRLEAISARAAAAARITEEARRRESAALAHLAEGLVGALELDRYEFVRQASARGAEDLVAPRRRKASEVSAPPAPAAEPAAAGRMAS